MKVRGIYVIYGFFLCVFGIFTFTPRLIYFAFVIPIGLILLLLGGLKTLFPALFRGNYLLYSEKPKYDLSEKFWELFVPKFFTSIAILFSSIVAYHSPEVFAYNVKVREALNLFKVSEYYDDSFDSIFDLYQNYDLDEDQDGSFSLVTKLESPMDKEVVLEIGISEDRDYVLEKVSFRKLIE